jgi:hypothetical protein
MINTILVLHSYGNPKMESEESEFNNIKFHYFKLNRYTTYDQVVRNTCGRTFSGIIMLDRIGDASMSRFEREAIEYFASRIRFPLGG